jgi:hypothetical protein
VQSKRLTTLLFSFQDPQMNFEYFQNFHPIPPSAWRKSVEQYSKKLNKKKVTWTDRERHQISKLCRLILLIVFREILARMDIEVVDSCNNDYKDVDECHERFNQLKNKCWITMIFFSWKLSFLAFRNYTVFRLNNSYRELFSPIFRLSSDERFSINCSGIMDMLLIRFTMKDISKFLFKTEATGYFQSFLLRYQKKIFMVS